ncbi:hypothetical protein F4774DRAFT_399911 [Daldinia eschscholtzii]|nr:hypothetical protein F4774DRAFT_399911 [Daldinia eschscholtzii]
MVYDDRGNFVGDTHWHEDYDFDEGEELELERGGTIVQVAECTGSRDQDLSELIDKRARERAERQSAALARRPPTAEAATSNVATPHFQLRHKPLHNVIGTPTGHHGRALMPTESPYEERQKQVVVARDNDLRPAKRRRREVSPPSKSGYAQSLFGASLTLSGTPTSSPLLRSKPPKVTSVSTNNQPLSSAISNTHDNNSDVTQISMRGVNAKGREDIQLNTSRGLLSKEAHPERPATATRDSIKLQPPLLPLSDKVDINEYVPPTNEKQSRLIRRKQTEIGTLEPTPVNLRSKGQESSEGCYPLSKDRHNALGNTASVTGSVNRAAEDTPSISRPTESVRSEGLPTKPKPKNKAKMVGNTEEHSDVVHEQPISEARTELRIKPRKKRGLVMISEKSNSDNSSTLRTSKSQINVQYQPALLSDITRDDSNEDIRDGLVNINTGIKEPNHTRRRTQDALSCDSLLVNSKSTHRQNTEIKGGTVHSEDDPPIPSPGIQGESAKDIETCVHDDQTNGERGTPSSPESKCGAPTERTRCLRSRGDLSRKKKRRRIGDSTDSCLTVEVDNKNRDMANEDDTALLDDVPAPRLAQLGRKSVRSKEVIGFIFDEEINNGNGPQWNERGGKDGKASLASGFSANQSTVQPPLAKESRAVSSGVSPESVKIRNLSAVDVKEISYLPQEQTIPTSARVSGNSDVQTLLSDDTTATRLPAAKMVVNPATRGKKAAKPSDAAGHVPQCPLPSEVTLGRLQDSKRREDNEQKARSEARRKACGAAMPGFARANGGPWSREAHDLFEFTRPL